MRITSLALFVMATAFISSSTAMAAYTNNGDGTVTDNTSNLTWDSCNLGQTGATCATGAAAMYTWSGAQTGAISMNAALNHGFADWCVPQYAILGALWINQLATMPNNVQDWYWASDTPGGGHWVVSFQNGGGSSAVGSAYVRLVRNQGNVYGGGAVCATTTSTATSNVTTTSATLTATVTNGASGTGYWIAILGGGTAPSAAQVVAAVSYGGATVVSSGNSAMAPGQSSTAFSVGGLTANTAYDLYFVGRDGAANSSSVSGPNSITTSQAASVPTMSEWGMILFGILLAGSAVVFIRRQNQSFAAS